MFCDYPVLSRLYELYLSIKDLNVLMNSIYCKIFIYMHNNLFAPLAPDRFGEVGGQSPLQLSSLTLLLKLKLKCYCEKLVLPRNDVYETLCPQSFACQEGFLL